MSKLNQIKIHVDILKEQGIETEFNYKLVREIDKLVKESHKITWLTWDHTDNSCSGMSNNIEVGKSLLMSPFNDFFTWQTTAVTEIVEQKENYIKFKTTNSVYELFKKNTIK